MLLPRFRQLQSALHRGIFHSLHRHLELLAHHGGSDVEIPRGQHRHQLGVQQRADGGADGSGFGIIQGENAPQRTVNGAEDRVVDLQILGQRHVHDLHEGGGAHHDLFAPHGAGQTAGLIALEVLHLAVEAALGAQQTVKQVGETGAGGADQAGGAAGQLLQRDIAVHLNAVELDGAGGEEVGVADEHAAGAGGSLDTGPSGHGAAVLFHAAGQPEPGLSIAQQSGERADGQAHDGGAPEKVLGPSPTDGGEKGQQQRGQQQDRGGAALEEIGLGGGLKLGTESVAVARLLGEGVPAVP